MTSSPPTGRASKQSAPAGCLPRPERRERPADGPAGPPHLGTAGPDTGVGPGGREASEGLRRGRHLAVPPTGPTGPVRPHLGQRVLRELVLGRVPGGVAEGVDRPGRGRLGRGWHASGRPDCPVAGDPGGSVELGEAPALRPDALSGRTAVELAQVQSVVQLCAPQCRGTRRTSGRRSDEHPRRSGEAAELLACFRPSATAGITFLTCCKALTTLNLRKFRER